MQPEISVIISIYNNVDRLELVLCSLELQSFKNFEVILSDDGSSPDSVSRIKSLIDSCPFSVKHVWHADDGWNKNRILNKSIVASESPYLIFIDGDCLLHGRFVEAHVSRRMPKTMLAGRRVNLSERVSKKLSPDLVRKGYLNSGIMIDCIRDRFTGAGGAKSCHGVYLGSSFIGKYLNRKDKGLLGSNFSVSKEDLLAVNGFDERFSFPAAGEDTDIEARLRRNGLKVKTVRNQAIQYHLYHQQLPRNKERLIYLDENNANQVTYTPHGISS